MSTTRTARLSAGAVALVLALSACGDGEEDTAASDETPTCPITATEVEPPAGSTTDLAKKPVIAANKAAKPTQLQYADIVEGDGEEAKTGDAVEVKYVGALYETGKEFDASWNESAEKTIAFGICREGVVPGFSVGPSGMKVGGRRIITLPPEFGYGAEGRPPAIPANSTLVFVVDLVKVGE